MISLDDWLTTLLKNTTNEKFKDVVSMKADLKPMDDGQVVVVSEINRVTLTLKTADGQQKQLNAVCKVALQSGPGRVLDEDYGLFDNEIMVMIHTSNGKLINRHRYKNYIALMLGYLLN